MTFSRTLCLLVALPVIAATPTPSANPFLQPWKTPFGAPPFQLIKESHYLPAFQEACARQKKEVAAITASKAKPTFENTVAALARSGELLSQVNAVFSNLVGAETTPTLQKLAEEVAPILSAHQDDIYLNETLFQRVKAVHDQKASLKLSAEQATLLERTYRTFVRGGANLQGEAKDRLRKLNAELSVLGLKFTDNVMKETNAYALVVDKAERLKGLPEGALATAAQEAKARGQEGKWVFTLKGPSIWPFLQYAEDRDLRRELLTAYAERCNHGGESDNKAVMARIATLRVQKAQLLGFKTWAHFIQADNMAGTPEGVYGLLNKLWPAALAKAKAERSDLQAMMEKDLPGQKLEAWDWRFYAEKVKKAKFDLNEEELRPYLTLANVRAGAFEVCRRLYGITFTPVKGVPVYHPEVETFEVKDKDGKHLGLFFLDSHPRPGKRVGAWMSNYREQWIEKGKETRPIVVNVGNYSRPNGDTPALLTTDETRTLFHELGHGLHGLLTRCQYRPTSGTNVPTDFVELPSQIMENWAFQPEVLKLYAKHYKTGEPMPQALIDKIKKAGTFNQGFATTEYLAAALLDLDWHALTEAKDIDAAAFEKASLEKMGLIPEVISRYRTTYFLHSATDYSAGYYSYIWSAVLDSDAFQAFKEKGNLFDPATAKAFRTEVLEKGGSRPAMEMYKSFRGAEPKVDALLQKRGLK